MKFSDYICDTLSKFGCEMVFGVPGSLIDPVWKSACESSNLNIITCTHECDAAYIANSYSKGSRKLVAVFTTGGPGVTNALTGISSASRDSIPMIYISGIAPVNMWGLGTRQEESSYDRAFLSVNITKQIVKYSVIIDDITNACDIFNNCCKIAMSGRPGVVHICIPIDVQNENIKINKVGISCFYTESCIKRDLSPHFTRDFELINKCKHPLIIMGWGCYLSDCIEFVYKLAHKIVAPILVTSKGVTCERYDDNLFLGNLGTGDNRAVINFLLEYNTDCLLIFGSSVGIRDLCHKIKSIVLSTQSVFVFNCEDSAISRRIPHCKILLTNNMKKAVYELQQLVDERKNIKLQNDIRLVKKKQEELYERRIMSTDSMALAIKSLNNIVNSNCTLTADAGNNLLDTLLLFRPRYDSCFFVDMGIRAMGNGLCSSIGLAFAFPNKSHICIVGDGALLMNGNSLYLAARYGLKVFFLVLNNKALGRIKIAYNDIDNTYKTSLGEFNICGYAESLGIESHRIESYKSIESLFSAFISRKDSKPMLVELVTDSMEIPITLKTNIE